MNKGRVYLVGAGPYDVGLLTVKAKSVIETAEVVVFDRLVSAEILGLIPDTTEQIDVGKNSGNHPVPQERINEILLEKALEGKVVVRLKGGDPFLFGRGGEELELLVEHNIHFEIVPGITSAIAVPAFAGIPVTHRDFCSSLHIISAHKKRGSTEEIDFSTLARLDSTLVFLMGVSVLESICAGLIAAGMKSTMPAAVIERGTSPRQKTIVGTLATLAALASAAEIASPAVIIVGEVCTLSERFSWQKPRNRVIVTRPHDRASLLSDMLRKDGIEVLELPLIETKPLPISEQFSKALSEIKSYRYIVFTSTTAVELFFKILLERKTDVRELSLVKFAVVGVATKNAVEHHGVLVDLIPEQFNGDALGKLLVEKIKSGEQILLLRAKSASPQLPQILAENGVAFSDIAVYETTCKKLKLDLQESDIVAFTSSSAVRAFAQCDVNLKGTNAVCIGEKTAATAEKYGMRVCVSQKATLDSLSEKIKGEYYYANGI